MASIIEGPLKTFTAGGALLPYRLVKLSSGALAYPSTSDTVTIGVLEAEAFAAGDRVPVRLRTAEGTWKVQASAAIAAGDSCYIGANGTVADTGTQVIGMALEASGGSGAIIEVLPSMTAVLGSLARASLVEDALQPYPVTYERYRVWDAPATNAVGSPANDDLGIIDNTFLTGAPTIETGDLKNAGATTRRIGFMVPVPVEYVAGQDAQIVINAGMKTTVASVSATVDLEAVRIAAPSVDIVATNAISINSLTAADRTFTLTATNLVPGDVLYCRVSVAVNDSGTGTAVIGQINSITAKFDIKG